VAGARPLPLDGGSYLVRMPANGRMETSSPYNSSIDQNEFFVVTMSGLQRLVFSQAMMARSQPATEGYAVQSAFGFFQLEAKTAQSAGKCVFVGARADFLDNGRDCQSWDSGQSEPPKFKRHIVFRGSENSR